MDDYFLTFKWLNVCIFCTSCIILEHPKNISLIYCLPKNTSHTNPYLQTIILFQVNLFRNITFRNSKQTYDGIPVMASNMDTVGTFQMAKALSKVRTVQIFKSSPLLLMELSRYGMSCLAHFCDLQRLDKTFRMFLIKLNCFSKGRYWIWFSWVGRYWMRNLSRAKQINCFISNPLRAVALTPQMLNGKEVEVMSAFIFKSIELPFQWNFSRRFL